jgi:hypothetical protein
MKTKTPAINPLVRDLLAADGDVLLMGGYVGPADDPYIRLYADLTLRRYIEIAKKDVVRLIEDPEKPEEPCMIYFRSSAELKYVQIASFKGDQVAGAMLHRCDGCGSEQAPQRSIAQQIPYGDIFDRKCREDIHICGLLAGNSTWRRFWCAAEFVWCQMKSTPSV